MEKIESLVELIQAPDTNLTQKHEAFGQLVNRFQDMAYGCAYAILEDTHLAQDAAQEAFVEAYLKVNEFSKKSRKTAAELIEPLMRHLTEDACLASISEIFDGDPPHTPRGCCAQAWSVAELLRAKRLLR